MTTLMALHEIAGMIDRAGITCNCSGHNRFNKIFGYTIGCYDHDAGYTVLGFEQRQWIFFTCIKCGYDWNLGKLLNRWKQGRAHHRLHPNQIDKLRNAGLTHRSIVHDYKPQVKAT